jgi:hypothetical protein
MVYDDGTLMVSVDVDAPLHVALFGGGRAAARFALSLASVDLRGGDGTFESIAADALGLQRSVRVEAFASADAPQAAGVNGTVLRYDGWYSSANLSTSAAVRVELIALPAAALVLLAGGNSTVAPAHAAFVRVTIANWTAAHPRTAATLVLRGTASGDYLDVAYDRYSDSGNPRELYLPGFSSSLSLSMPEFPDAFCNASGGYLGPVRADISYHVESLLSSPISVDLTAALPPYGDVFASNASTPCPSGSLVAFHMQVTIGDGEGLPSRLLLVILLVLGGLCVCGICLVAAITGLCILYPPKSWMPKLRAPHVTQPIQ